MELGTLISESGRVMSTFTPSDGIVYGSAPYTISSILQRRFQSFLLKTSVETPSFVLQEAKNFPDRYPLLLSKLEKMTSQLDIDPYAEGTVKTKEALKKVDPYSALREEVKRLYRMPEVTNASLKFIELMRFVQKEGGKLCVDSMFDNAALPGAFILTAKHLFETECEKPLDWIASSWVSEEPSGALVDTYKLFEKEPDRWIMDMPGEGKINGDVTDPNVVEGLVERVKETFPKGVELYTSDIGTESKGKQEIDSYNLNYGQIVVGLMSLEIGGTFVIKMFTATTPFTVSLLYNMVPLFEKLYMTKPLTSRQANSETYIVGLKFKGITERMRKDMLSSLSVIRTEKDAYKLQFGDTTYLDESKDTLYKAQRVLIEAYQIKMLEFVFREGPYYSANTTGRYWARLFTPLRKKWISEMKLKASQTPLPREVYQKPQTTRIVNKYEDVTVESTLPISTSAFETSSYGRTGAPALASLAQQEPEKKIRKKKEEKKEIRRIVNIPPTKINLFSYDPLDMSPGESTELYNKRLAIYRRLVSSNMHPLIADSESRIQVNIDNLDVGY